MNEDGDVEHFFVDADDSSMTRSFDYYIALFEFAGFRMIHKELQPDFPDDLFSIWMVAFAPVSTS
jgi:hypothetical protein